VSDGVPQHPGLAVIHHALRAVLAAGLPEELDDQVRDALDALTGFCSSPMSVPALLCVHRAVESERVRRVMREGGLPLDEVLAGSDGDPVGPGLRLLRTEPAGDQAAEGSVERATDERAARPFAIVQREMEGEGAAEWPSPRRKSPDPEV
jgi:hypothetical protein